MEQVNFEVFPTTAEAPTLRLTDAQRALIGERALTREDIDSFATTVDRDYQAHSPDLLGLGEALYNWLDGPTERWLERLVGSAGGLAVHIDCEERLRHLPWELLAAGGRFLGVDPLRPVTPVYRVTQRAGEQQAANRPLRVLFIATSPEDVTPMLSFEQEEATILRATGQHGIELVVEESGSLAGLEYLLGSFGPDYFDVLHLSGHAGIDNETPVFMMEDDEGFRADATADDIARAIQGLWPGLVFLSGCMTGQASEQGAVPSMAEALVHAGAPAVLGWALPVGDLSATTLASELYARLSIGQRIDEATARSRQQLHETGSAYWHLLRLYSDDTALAELVTRPQAPGRTVLKARRIHEDFLDPWGNTRVTAREGFVGRRRQIQRCLRTLRHSADDPSAEVLVLHGTGGLGKSTLASRLIERMGTTHNHGVWFGKLDEQGIRKLTTIVQLGDLGTHVAVNEILNTPDISLEDRFRYLLDGPLASVPCLFVFDDFENGNLERRDGTYVATRDALDIVAAVAGAIRSTGSPSRLIITSRYTFPLSGSFGVTWEGMASMHGSELQKKLRLTTNLRPDAPGPAAVRESAIATAAGNPRLIEWLDLVLSDDEINHEALLTAVAEKAEEFREEVLARELLAAQTAELRRVLALASVFELPVPVEAVQAVNGDQPIQEHLERAASVGLIEAATDPTTRRLRYLVSSIISPLLAGVIEAEERSAACAAGARVLHRLWVEESGAGD